MKRIQPHTLPEYGIHKIKTFFKWIPCEKCNMEFRREYIWECFIRSFFPDSNIFGYICMHCAPTIEDAIKFRAKVRERYNKPIPSPKGGTGESR